VSRFVVISVAGPSVPPIHLLPAPLALQQLKVILTGVPVEGYFGEATLLAKIVGLALALGSGLFIGASCVPRCT
jgi:hypothetical protein